MQKHSSGTGKRVGDIFSKYKPSNTTFIEYNKKGKDVLEAILKNPKKVIVKGEFMEKSPGVKEETFKIYIKETGEGVRLFKSDGQISGFINITKK